MGNDELHRVKPALHELLPTSESWEIFEKALLGMEPKVILVLNGPNLNMLGLRNPEIYGKESLMDILEKIRDEAASQGYIVASLQTNHEGELIDRIQHSLTGVRTVIGILLNAGGLTHTSVSLRDAVEIARDFGVPTVEVHLSDIALREEFRQKSLLTAVCIAQVKGLLGESYIVGLHKLLEYIKNPAHT